MNKIIFLTLFLELCELVIRTNGLASELLEEIKSGCMAAANLQQLWHDTA